MTLNLSKERLNIIVAYTSANRYIGYKNDLPWKRSLRADMNFINLMIRQKTNCAVIMGRNTYDSMPKKKKLIQIVLTQNRSYTTDNAIVMNSLEEAINYCKNNNLYIIIFGGSSVYEEAFRWKYKLFCTVVTEGELVGDVKFPETDVQLTNISAEVNAYLVSNNIKQSWELENEEFKENGFLFKFFIGES